MQNNPLLISERDAAKALGLCAKSLYLLRRRGELPYVLVGSRVLYRPADLENWIAQRVQTGGVK
jgi:predicted DNA-binding transcriptional regulator AlpA